MGHAITTVLVCMANGSNPHGGCGVQQEELNRCACTEEGRSVGPSGGIEGCMAGTGGFPG